MSNRLDISKQGAKTVDSTTSPSFKTFGMPFMLLEVISSSSLSVKVYVDGLSGTFRTVRCYTKTGASTSTSIDPDTATGALAAQDYILVPTLGADNVQIQRAAGSGTVAAIANPNVALDSWLLMLLIDGGLSATITGVSTEAKQDTMITSLQLIDNIETGATPYSLLSAATTNATVVKASAGRLFKVTASNYNASPRYLKIYDRATTPDETHTPVIRMLIPGNTAGSGNNHPIAVCGETFATGIAFRLTAGTGLDADTNAVATAEIMVNLSYK